MAANSAVGMGAGADDEDNPALAPIPPAPAAEAAAPSARFCAAHQELLRYEEYRALLTSSRGVLASSAEAPAWESGGNVSGRMGRGIQRDLGA